MIDWLIVFISINRLSVWRPCCQFWCRWLSLWQSAVPRVDVGASHWQQLSVLVFIIYEYWLSLFRLMLLLNMHAGTGLSVWRLCRRLWHRGLHLWQAEVPLVDAGSSHWQLLPVLVSIPYEYTCWLFDEYTRIDILTHWPWDQMADIFNKFLQRKIEIKKSTWILQAVPWNPN